MQKKSLIRKIKVFIVMVTMVLIAEPLSEFGDIFDDLEITESEASEIQEEKEEVLSIINPSQQSRGGSILYQGELTEGHYSLYLSIGIMVTAISFLQIALLSVRKTKDHSSQDIVMVTGLIVVVMGALFLSIASTSTEGMTTSISLLSAIAGYIFGAQSKNGKAGKNA